MPKRRRQGYCPHPEKVKHPNERSALSAAKRMLREANSLGQLQGPLYTYPCHCGAIHITHLDRDTSTLLLDVPEELQRWAFPKRA